MEQLALADERIVPLRHYTNRGKGAALRTAIGKMTGDIAVIQDADLEYDPADIPRLIAPILEGRADAVFGSRFLSGAERRVLFFWHSVGNNLLTLISNALTDLNLSDIETGYKAVRADLLANLRLRSNRFGIEPEITARLAQWRARIYEVPISYHGRSYEEGKHIGWRDGIHALGLMFRLKFLDTQFVTDLDHLSRQNLVRSRGLRAWLLDQFAGEIDDRVLELMPGPGATTSLLLNRDLLILAEPVARYRDTLERRYGHLENVVFATDLDMDLLSKCRALEPATIVCFDALQRVSDPDALLKRLAQLIGLNGKILIHVPQDPTIYGRLDRQLGHERRFDRESLIEIVEAAGLRIKWLREFNRLGRWAWRSIGTRRDSITWFDSALARFVAPIAKRVDNFSLAPGLSLVAVAERHAPASAEEAHA
jgi:hypothetical protein